MKIYLAGRFTRQNEFKGYADLLTLDGHEITANWVYGGEEGLRYEDIAELDTNDVLRADAILAFSEPYGSENRGGGRHSEWGIAIAAKKILLLVGQKEQVFHWYPGVIQMPKFESMRNYLKGK